MATTTSPSELVLKFACPACGHRLTMPVRKAGMQAPCPKCSQPVSAPPIDSSVSGYDAIAAAVKATMPPPPVSPPPASHTPPPRPQPVPLPVKESLDELPPPLATVADPVVGRTSRGGFALPWRARWTARLVYWGTIVVVFVLYLTAMDARSSEMASLLAVSLLLWIFVLGRLITKWLLPLLHQHFTCPGCHEVHEAVALWNCGCGYVPHRPKHLFSKCPECGERGGKTKCPCCGVSMLIW